ncbi:16S rRNA (guanine(966)-N(2))-methyltransferase RsmD [Oceanicella actignis]|uniref:16S rRNA (guanine(966)-N(2))-methyltransferase RsmD n=1 Tax=Oceanicella actignis TaxID=1189325 RepID=UPI0011E6E3CD|nr:16S rRNA (guanine(966)-N(2))-methyltransferase RsmD [Oceanicella actignis]TYO89542.1 16S rRNA (guanine966-N2)-methyltransferase [Oceanicella actignis]
MRVVGGALRGRRLAAPGAAGGGAAHLRPTADRVREALFNILAHGVPDQPPPPQGRRVLDLFAGTGALGVEALSRGAERATFVDDLPAARALIRENVENLGLIGRARILRRDATRLGPCRERPYDLVFLDPPYAQGLGERALGSAQEGGWLAPGALIVWEEAAEVEPALPAWAELVDARRMGPASLRILRAR